MAFVSTAFAVFALALASVGIFASISFHLAARRREIGIRAAIGATPSDLVRFVLQAGLRPVFLGTVIGFLGAIGAARVLRSQLYDTAPHDPVVMIAALAALFIASIGAILGPAYRAGGVDPSVALRSE
jgi:putative ABC transport system permease protein